LTAYLLVLFAFLFWFREHFSGTGGSFSSLFSYGRHNIGIGIFVLLGNFVGMLFLTIDRLMVSSLFTIQQFAIYSFAVAVVTVSYTFVTAVSQVFFPYVSAALPDLRTRAYHLGKPAIILSWAASLAIYFPLTKLVEFYLPWYLDSLRVMQILFCTVGFGSLIQILHINYYKAYRRQRDYFILAIAALAMSAMLNLLAIHFWGSLVSVAVATVASFAAWCIANELRLRHIVSQTNWQLVRGLGIILGYLAVFWFVSSVIEGFVAQTVTYVAIYLLLTWLLLRSEVRELVATVR